MKFSVLDWDILSLTVVMAPEVIQILDSSGLVVKAGLLMRKLRVWAMEPITVLETLSLHVKHLLTENDINNSLLNNSTF